MLAKKSVLIRSPADYSARSSLRSTWFTSQLCLVFFFFFQLCHLACRILVPWSGIESVPPEVEAWSLNHWTTKEVRQCFLTLGVGPFCAALELHLPHLVQVTLILTSQIPLQQEVNDARRGSRAGSWHPSATYRHYLFLFFNWSMVDLWEICMQVKKQQLELDMEGQTGSK